MRFIHTADWHLGRLMHGERLTDDQAHVLAQLVDLVRDVKPVAVLIAGDVYDRAVPPPDAVALLDDVLSRLVLDLDVTVIMIAGNHDSPLRLEFGSKVLARRGLYVFGSLHPDGPPVTLFDDSGPIRFHALPFAEPGMVRERLSCETLPDHNAAMRAMIERIRGGHPQKERSVLLAHAFVAGGQECESERPLSVGGADRVDPSSFGGFDYVALGHLHRPQQAGAPQIRYAGSLLRYSFSEVDHAKSVNVVEMDELGTCRIESVALTPRREVRRISGFLNDILKGPAPGESRDDYVMVTLHDTGAILDVMGKLREVYPNVLHVERPGLTVTRKEAGLPTDHRTLNDADLFSAFFLEVTGTELSESEAAAYQVIVDASRQKEREAAFS